MITEFWKEKLPKKAQQLYEDMLIAFLQYQDEVFCGDLDIKKIQDTYIAIYFDHPEIFYLPYNPQIIQKSGLNGLINILSIKKIYDISTIKKYNVMIEQVKKNILTNIYTQNDIYEKIKIICNFILENVSYDINNTYNQNSAAILINHIGQCSGIARAVKWMLSWFNVESIIVNGIGFNNQTGQSGPHDWNIVKINNKYHHLDVTFMLGTNLGKTQPFRYNYFLYSDDEISKDHIWDKKLTPICEQLECSYVKFQNNENKKIISSLYEFRNELKQAIILDKHQLIFNSKIIIDNNELMKLIKKCCQEVLNSLNKKIILTINIQNNNVSILW